MSQNPGTPSTLQTVGEYCLIHDYSPSHMITIGSETGQAVLAFPWLDGLWATDRGRSLLGAALLSTLSEAAAAVVQGVFVVRFGLRCWNKT